MSALCRHVICHPLSINLLPRIILHITDTIKQKATRILMGSGAGKETNRNSNHFPRTFLGGKLGAVVVGLPSDARYISDTIVESASRFRNMVAGECRDVILTVIVSHPKSMQKVGHPTSDPCLHTD